MRPSPSDDMLMLPLDMAYLVDFRVHNIKWLRFFCWTGLIAGLITMIVITAKGAFGSLIAPLFGVAFFTLMVLGLRREQTWGDHLRFLGYFFIVILLVSIADSPFIWEPLGDDRLGVYLLVPLFLFFFRLRTLDALNGVAIYCAILTFDALVPFALKNVMQLLILVVCIAAEVGMVIVISKFRRKRFGRVWKFEHNRNKERLRMKVELEQARKLQLSMLPKEPPRMMQLDIAGSSTPATEVGGDYYNFFHIDDQQLALVVGDVSGHGLAPGLVLQGIRSSLHLLRDQWTEPVEILTRLNRMMKETTEKKTFMTFLYAILDQSAGHIRLANAGHPPTLHFRQNEQTVTTLRYPALPLGGILNATYVEIKIPFVSGDVFLFYSDGLTEAWNHQDKQYGEERLIKRFNEAAPKMNAEAVHDALMADLNEFIGSTEQADDITLVVVKIK